MAQLVTKKADVFALDVANTTVDIPYPFGQLVRRLVVNEVSEKVTLIKYARETFLDSNGHTLCLKDAKDILDHYFNTAHYQPAHNGGQQK